MANGLWEMCSVKAGYYSNYKVDEIYREWLSTSRYQRGSESYTFDPSSGFRASGSYGDWDNQVNLIGKIYEAQKTFVAFHQGGYFINATDIKYTATIRLRCYYIAPSKGTFIRNVTAPVGTFPQNGAHTDGYWYVYKGLASNASVNIGGIWKDTTQYVNVNGVWKQNSDIKVNVNGIWK